MCASFFFRFIIFCLEEGVLFAYFLFLFCFDCFLRDRDRKEMKLDEVVVRGIWEEFGEGKK